MRLDNKNIEIYYIYRLLFPNDKVYIGQTGNFKNRMGGYKRSIRYNNNLLIYNAIKKYGWENIKKDILLKCDIKYADFFERSFITGYKAIDRKYGYNLESGGNKNKKLSDETKRKISKARIGKYAGKNHPLYGTKRPDLSILFSGKNNPFYGKKHTDEFRMMISNRMSGENHPFYGKKRPDVGKNNKNKMKKISAFDINGAFIKNFNSIKEAHEELNVFNISKVLKGTMKHTKGYTFRYLNDIK